MHRRPKLKTVEKVKAPYPLNNFPDNFGYKLGEEIIYIHATKNKPTIEGEDWEQILARCIDAEWKPSNVGLDDVILGNMAFSAKTVKNNNPQKAKKVRLISGRNSIVYSYGEDKVANVDPDKAGRQVLSIWNERVSAIREKFSHLRTVVLLKGPNLEEVGVFEFETIRYDPELFFWGWNDRGNLEGYDRETRRHIFTWQPHGSQFTIIEDVPDELLVVRIRKYGKADRSTILKGVGFCSDWIEVYKRHS